jgi:hypothetical protein
MKDSICSDWTPPRFDLGGIEPTPNDWYAQIEDIASYTRARSGDPMGILYVEWTSEGKLSIKTRSRNLTEARGSRAVQIVLRLSRWSLIPFLHLFVAVIFGLAAFYMWWNGDHSGRIDYGSIYNNYSWFIALSSGAVVFIITWLLSLKIRRLILNG